MLVSLAISNYAIIDKVHVQFGKKLNVITGETGAGKSILLGALNLILGARADTSMLLDKNKKCIVEGEFQIAGKNLEPFFEANDLDYEELTIIRREIGANSKSRAFVNDSPVQLNILKELSSRLIDIHSQHQSLLIREAGFQMSILDSYAGLNHQVEEYQKLFREFNNLEIQLEELTEKDRIARRDQDYLRFQLNEIESYQLKPGEDKLIEDELLSLRNADKIMSNLAHAIYLLDDDENSLYKKLAELMQLIGEISSFHPGVAEANNKLAEINEEIRQLRFDLNGIFSTIEIDEEKLKEATERQDVINHLLLKHHVPDISGLYELADEFREKLNGLDDMEEEIERTKKLIIKTEKDLLTLGKKLSHARLKAVRPLEEKLTGLLKEVGIPEAVIRFKISQPGSFFQNGLDSIQILFSSNPGISTAPLAKVSSGGELSRLMLCLKYILAGKTALPTVIFDEIDMGISGEISIQVGALLKQMSKSHQLIAITHLPQTAARGDDHFLVIKKIQDGRTATSINKLGPQDRIEEIAKMVGGEKPGQPAYDSAKEMVTKFV